MTGPFTWFDQALVKMANGIIDLAGSDFKLVLSTSSQTLDKTFAGASTYCRYADLTAQLATGNGYTTGGTALPSPTLYRVGSKVVWSSGTPSWTTTASLTFKYGVIYDNTATNKDLVCFCDFDPTGSGITVTAGVLSVVPDSNGILYWESV